MRRGPASPLRDLLDELGTSRRDLQRRGGPDATTLWDWEARGKLPTLAAIRRIAEVLGVPVARVAAAVLDSVAMARARAATPKATPHDDA